MWGKLLLGSTQGKLQTWTPANNGCSRTMHRVGEWELFSVSVSIQRGRSLWIVSSDYSRTADTDREAAKFYSYVRCIEANHFKVECTIDFCFVSLFPCLRTSVLYLLNRGIVSFQNVCPMPHVQSYHNAVSRTVTMGTHLIATLS